MPAGGGTALMSAEDDSPVFIEAPESPETQSQEKRAIILPTEQHAAGFHVTKRDRFVAAATGLKITRAAAVCAIIASALMFVSNLFDLYLTKKRADAAARPGERRQNVEDGERQVLLMTTAVVTASTTAATPVAVILLITGWIVCLAINDKLRAPLLSAVTCLLLAIVGFYFNVVRLAAAGVVRRFSSTPASDELSLATTMLFLVVSTGIVAVILFAIFLNRLARQAGASQIQVYFRAFLAAAGIVFVWYAANLFFARPSSDGLLGPMLRSLFPLAVGATFLLLFMMVHRCHADCLALADLAGTSEVADILDDVEATATKLLHACRAFQQKHAPQPS
jgi:hypothetical protein